MAWPVAILAVLSIVGGFLAVPGGWNAIDTWLEPVAPSIPEASGVTLAFSILAALASALAGIWLAYRLYGGPSERPAELRGRYPWAARTLEQKFYFDEAYDLAFYEPSARTAVGLTRFVETPLVLRLSRRARGRRPRRSRAASPPRRPGRVRSYVLASPPGSPSSPSSSSICRLMTTVLILFPIAAAVVLWLLPWAHGARRRRASRSSSRSPSSPSGSAPRSTSTSAPPGSSTTSGRSGSPTSASPTRSGSSTSRSGSSG